MKKKRFMCLLLVLCICVSLLTGVVSAAATGIEVSDASYYDNGDVESLSLRFGWNTASATSRLTVMTERLRSAGETGTDKNYGDFTDYGYYGTSYSNWNAVLADSDTFGMLYYTDEKKISMGSTTTFSIGFEEGDIPMDIDETYYLYLWTYYNGHYYPDNLFMVLRVDDGKFQYAPAISTNNYGAFTTLRESAPDSVIAPNPSASQSASLNFVDVSSGDYFAKPVAWAVSCGVTKGTSSTPGIDTFSPNQTCTRGHILTFLWRAAGSPAPSISNPYRDIKAGEWYYEAALWAAEMGIYNTSGGTFAPNTPCTRASTVEYFWKYAGSLEMTAVPFSDVTAGTTLAKAVSWAVNRGITNGTGGTTFTPNQICTRAQIVTFLYRYFCEPMDNSALINSLRNGTASSAPQPSAPQPSAPAFNGQLDPLPPVDYMLQPDWYGSLTPVDQMSNARLVAEYEQIDKVVNERMANDIYMSDGPYSRQLDLWSALSQRCDKVERYDRGLKNGDLSDSTVAEYNQLVAAYGDAEPLRQSSEYDG